MYNYYFLQTVIYICTYLLYSFSTATRLLVTFLKFLSTFFLPDVGVRMAIEYDINTYI